VLSLPFEASVAVILGLAAFIFCFTGFGFAQVALPLLSLLMPLKEAVQLHYPFAIILVVYHAWVYRVNVNLKKFWRVFAGAIVGMPIGVIFLMEMPEVALKRGLALFILLALPFVGSDWGRRISGRFTTGRWGGTLLGVLSGWLQGVYATGGPPAIIYIMRNSHDPEEIKGFLGSYFSFIAIITAVLYGVGGMLNTHRLVMSGYYSPAVFFGAVLGVAASRRVGAKWFKHAVYGLLIVSAILLWVWA
jgi:uncharacterized membrane protein YfcA